MFRSLKNTLSQLKDFFSFIIFSHICTSTTSIQIQYIVKKLFKILLINSKRLYSNFRNIRTRYYLSMLLFPKANRNKSYWISTGSDRSLIKFTCKNNAQAIDATFRRVRFLGDYLGHLLYNNYFSRSNILNYRKKNLHTSLLNNYVYVIYTYNQVVS